MSEVYRSSLAVRALSRRWLRASPYDICLRATSRSATTAALGAPVAAACSSAVRALHGVCALRRGAAMAAGASPPGRARLGAAALLLATVGALLPGAHGGAPTMWLQGLLEIDPLAVCNDGSPAGFYFVPGTTQSNIWLVYLEGGMWCVHSIPALARCVCACAWLARGCTTRLRTACGLRRSEGRIPQTR